MVARIEGSAPISSDFLGNRRRSVVTFVAHMKHRPFSPKDPLNLPPSWGTGYKSVMGIADFVDKCSAIFLVVFAVLMIVGGVRLVVELVLSALHGLRLLGQ